MSERASDPIIIPDSLWRRPEMTEALKARDVGWLFRLLRQYAGASQTKIAIMCGLAQGKVSQIMKPGGSKVTAFEVIERIADGLDMPDHARINFGLAPRRRKPDVPAASPAPEDRAALIERLCTAKAVDAEVIAVLRNETENIRLLDRRLGNVAAAERMKAHIRQLETTLRYSLPGKVRRCLACILADSSALAGWQAVDAGNPAAAWDHFERAKHAAREAEDCALLAFAQGEQAYVLFDLEQYVDARELVSDAYANYSKFIPARLRAWLKMVEAEIVAGCALPGRRDEELCRKSIDKAMRLLPVGDGDADLPFVVLNAAHLARWRGNCLVHFGDAEAIDDLKSAFSAMEPGVYARAEAGLRCDLASALFAQGEIVEARTEIDAAAQLAKRAGSVRQQRRIDQLAARVTPTVL